MLAIQGVFLWEALETQNQITLYSDVSSVGNMEASETQEVEAREASLIITLSDPRGTRCFLGNSGITEVRITSIQGTLLPGHTARVPLNYMLWLLPGNFGFPMTMFQWVRRRVTIMAGVIDPSQQKHEVGLPISSCSYSREGQNNV